MSIFAHLIFARLRIFTQLRLVALMSVVRFEIIASRSDAAWAFCARLCDAATGCPGFDITRCPRQTQTFLAASIGKLVSVATSPEAPRSLRPRRDTGRHTALALPIRHSGPHVLQILGTKRTPSAS
jgi:hypothetical protein